jgi:methyl-branched lipid omega-hydroxylase
MTSFRHEGDQDVNFCSQRSRFIDVNASFPPVQRDSNGAPDLSSIEFWKHSLDLREAAFAELRAAQAMPFLAEPETGAAGIEQGPGYYAVTRHADILEVSRQSELYSSARGATSIADLPEFMNDFFGSMINMDDPRHARLRKIVSAAFTPKMLKRVEDDVQRAATAIVDDVLAGKGTGDFVLDVAAKLPLKVICDMMGIPPDKYDVIFTRSNIILGLADPEYMPETDPDTVVLKLLEAGNDLHTLVSELGAERRLKPTDDLTSALVNADVDGEGITDQELGSFFILLVVAGNETTRNAIAHGLNLLTKNPEQKALWLTDIEAHMNGAVEEIVRVAAPVIWMRRTTTKAVVLGGNEIPADSKLLLYYWAANRDENVFPNPYTFDISRSPNPHLGFGGPGPHFCLGAHLARREIGVMFRELLQRIPTVMATGEPDRLTSSFINGIKHLPYSY